MTIRLPILVHFGGDDRVIVGLVFAAFVFGTSAVSILIYRITRVFFFHAEVPANLELARTIALRVGALHALVIAFMFANLQANQSRIEVAADAEAGALINILIDAQDFEATAAEPVHSAVVAYAASVETVEWPAIRKTGRPSHETRGKLFAMKQAVLALAATAPSPVDGARLTADVFQVEDHRQQRLLGISAGAGATFWIAAVGGLVATMVCLAAHRPAATTYLILLVFAFYTGLMFFLVWDLATPFSGATALSPAPFARVVETAAGIGAPPGGDAP